MPNQFRLLVAVFAHINLDNFHSLVKNSPDFHQLSLENDLWKAKYQLHFPDSFKSLTEDNTTEKNFNWFEQFFLCFQDKYRHLTPKQKILMCLIKEDDHEALNSFSIELTDLDKVFDTPRQAFLFALSFDLKNIVDDMLLRDKSILNAKDGRGATPLFHATVSNNFNLVKKLLSLGADSSIRLEGIDDFYKKHNIHENDTPLHAAITLNFIEIVNCLLKANADPNALTKEGLNSLQLAAEVNHAEIVSLICESKKVNINDCTDIGLTALMITLLKDCLHSAEILLKQKADPSIPQSQCKADTFPLAYDDINKIQIGDAPIHVAVKLRSNHYVSILVEHGASLEQANSTGDNALQAAVLAGNADMVKFLLTFPRINVNSLSPFGATPLLLATELGFNEIAFHLIQKGADFSIPLAKSSEYHRQFGVIAGDNSLDAAKHLKNTELATVLMKVDTENKTAYRQLLRAVTKNDLESLKKILQCSKNQINTIHPAKGITLLHFAVAEGFNDIALYLLNMGADETIPARKISTYKCAVAINENDTVMHTAVRFNNEVIVNALIKKNPRNVERINSQRLIPIEVIEDKKSVLSYHLQLTKLKLDIHRYAGSTTYGGFFNLNKENRATVDDIKIAVNAMKKLFLHEDKTMDLSPHIQTIKSVPELRFIYEGLTGVKLNEDKNLLKASSSKI